MPVLVTMGDSKNENLNRLLETLGDMTLVARAVGWYRLAKKECTTPLAERGAVGQWACERAMTSERAAFSSS